MKNYSLEDLAKNINSEKTKDYFKEVLSSYYNENFRASIVTLYSVVICDLIHKLETLDEIYEDETARKILDEIILTQEKNKTSPQWESDLIENIKKRTNILDNIDYVHITSLQQHRHLCAHPVINNSNKLYTPNSETVASHIKNMLESLLIKSPLLSKKILNSILKDVSEKKDLLIDKSSLHKYLISKYLKNTNPIVEMEMFRSLWKIVFSINNEQCNENRNINYKVLKLLYIRNSANCNKKIKEEQSYFSNIFDSPDTFNYIINFLSEFEYLFEDFREDVHLILYKYIKTDNNAKVIAWFLNESFKKHFEVLKSLVKQIHENPIKHKVSLKAFSRVIELGIIKGFIAETCDFLLWRFINAKNFDDADVTFSYFIENNLDKFTVKQLIKLCEGSNKNNQICERNQSKNDHDLVKEICLIKIGSDFDFTKYPKFFK